ncbi:Golgi phospho protein 3-domain-containing protein [Rhizophagus irregularis DAOM 181602=DAOM 197198]|nr:Golgi phospho protein 3-domain-containing protein [Rhizophagus irregularis DAOM 181602=DAOM 197198]
MASTSESGVRIAVDPNDILDDEDKKQPILTLMEEVLLLGLKDKQGYLSFWNDNIFYTLRGCILMELALRGRIAMTKDSNRRKCPLSDRIIEVLEDKLTGEVLLDEALKLMKNSEPMSVGNWIDLMSGETWNVMKIGYQLKQVRECLAKGLVDKGILRTEKRNFLLFDMATHPVSDSSTKEEIVNRAIHLLLNHELREKAYTKVDELLSEYSTHPFSKKVKADIPEGKELQVEVVFTVLNVFTKMDSIL